MTNNDDGIRGGIDQKILGTVPIEAKLWGKGQREALI